MLSTGTFNYFTMFWNALEVPIQNAVQPIVSALQGYVTGWFQLAVAAYLVSLMLIAAWSADESSSMHFFRQIFLAGAVYAIAATATAFNTWVSGLANGLVTGVSTAISGVFGGTVVSSASAFDGAANNLFAVGFAVFKTIPKYGWVDGILLGIFVDIYMVEAIIVVGFLFIIYLLSAVMLNFLIAFGPLFVACYLFPFTRQFCDGWVKTVVAALVTQIFITGLMTLFTLIITQFVAQTQTTLSGAGGSGVQPTDIVHVIVAMLMLVAVVLLFAFVGFHMGRLAQSIAAGAHAQFARLPSLPRSGSSSGGQRVIASSGSGGERQIAGPSASGDGAATGAQPPRQFAFERTVGNADE